MSRHYMIDLETLDNTQTSAIIAIGAVEFSLEHFDLGEEFYQVVDISSATKYGSVGGDTIKWWMQQSDDARKAIHSPQSSIPLPTAMGMLSTFINKNGIVWGNGSSFDISILEHAYEKLGIAAPWRFWNVRDCRTAEEMAYPKGCKQDVPRKGTHHNALEDAKYQAEYVTHLYQILHK